MFLSFSVPWFPPFVMAVPVTAQGVVRIDELIRIKCLNSRVNT